MPRKRLVIHPDGTSDEEDLTTEEDDELTALQEASAAAVEARDDAATLIASVRPDETLAGKLSAGTSLSAGESAQVLRWLGLRALGTDA